MSTNIIEKLYEILKQRKGADAKESYTASLYAEGSEKIAEKVLEEAQEFVDEAFLLDNTPNDQVVQRNIRAECADLIFHMLVMLAHHDVPPEDVFAVLEERFGISGYEAKTKPEAIVIKE